MYQASCQSCCPCAHSTGCGCPASFGFPACAPELRVDVILGARSSGGICGQVRDRCGCPAPNVPLRLVRVWADEGGEPLCEVVAKAVSDCCGMYRFDVTGGEDCAGYHILADGQDVCAYAVAQPACCTPAQECCPCRAQMCAAQWPRGVCRDRESYCCAPCLRCGPCCGQPAQDCRAAPICTGCGIQF